VATVMHLFPGLFDESEV